MNFFLPLLLLLTQSQLSAFYIAGPAGSASARFTLNPDSSLQLTVESATDVIVNFANSANQLATLYGVATPVVDHGVVNKWLLDHIALQINPIGSVLAYMGLEAPLNYLIADGSAFDQTKYPTLFAVLGTATLPDLRGLFLRGAGTNSDVASFGSTPEGGAVGNKQNDLTKMPTSAFEVQNDGKHQHQMRELVHVDFLNQNYISSEMLSGFDTAVTYRGYVIDGPSDTQRGGADWITAKYDTFTHNSLDHTHTITGGDNETRPKSISVHYIIRAK